MYYCYWRMWKNILSCWNLREVDTNIWNLDFLSVTQEEGSLICVSPVTVECCLMKHTPTTAHTLPPSLYQVGTLTSASEHLSTASCQLSTLHTTYTQVILSESSCWLGCRSKEIVLLRITRPVLISEKNNVILSFTFMAFYISPDTWWHDVWHLSFMFTTKHDQETSPVTEASSSFGICV